MFERHVDEKGEQFSADVETVVFESGDRDISNEGWRFALSVFGFLHILSQEASQAQWWNKN